MIKMNNYIGIGQINPKAGDFEFNAKKIIKFIKQAYNSGVNCIIFPQDALCGPLLDDVLKRHPFLIGEAEKWLNGIAGISDGSLILLGYLNGTLAVIKDGKVADVVSDFPYLVDNICITKDDNVLKSDIIVDFSLTSTREGEVYKKEDAQSYIAKCNETPLISPNICGATDNISYIGASSAFNKNGEIILRAKAYEEEFIIFDITKINEISKLPKMNVSTEEFSFDYEVEGIYKAIIQGIKDYFYKCGLKRAVLGLSGGLDSTVCAVLLTHALAKANVMGISMPSNITSNESKSDAKQLAENLGIAFIEMPIKPIVEISKDCFQKLFNQAETLWEGRYTKSYTNDNIQARARATYLWGISNEFSSCIPIATSDKSEAYMGYATINGDMSGGFAPIADVTKTKLFALAKWINKEFGSVIPESVILKRPGAELAIDEKTGKPLAAEDALMPYEFLDEIIWRIENKGQGYNDFVNIEFLYEKKNIISVEQKLEWLDKFYKRMSRALYKGSIMPPSVIVEPNTINKSVYSQPITSVSINYKKLSMNDINKICKDL